MLGVNICGKEFKNPVMTASGTFGFGEEYGQFYDLSRLGGICSKGITGEHREGNYGIRIKETTAGMLNSVGLQNPGVDGFIKEELPKMQKYNTNVIVNVGGSTVEEYISIIEKLNDKDVDIIELNISCPNVKHGGMALGIKSDVAYEAVKKVRDICKKPLMVKLSPNAENIVEMAKSCEAAGADALSLVNTFQGMAIDYKKRKAIFDNVYAGFSGPAIKPIALRMVHQVSKACKVPVIGLGGIANWEDALEFLMAGAKGIQIGTANFINPMTPIEIIDGIEKYLVKEKIKDINDIIGII